MRWFDHHCHLEPGPPAAEAISEATSAGVTRLLCVGTDEALSAAAVAVARQHRGVVWATAGCHPHEARHGWSWVEAALGDPLVVAVGECGLDYHYDLSPRDVQRQAFAAQIELANERSLPLVIHTREAWDDTFAMLDSEGVPARAVFHCFTGGGDEAEACLARGALLSFSGIASFPKATDVHEAVRLCPPERFLVETDSPYLAPVPHRGKTNRPAWVADVGAAVARLRGESPEEVAEATWRAASRLYGLPDGESGTHSTADAYRLPSGEPPAARPRADED